MNYSTKLITALILTTFVAGVGCKKVTIDPSTCTDLAGTQYQSGITSATTDNAADEARGRTDGGSLTEADGIAQGLQAAYDSGYNSPDGYKRGYDEQYPNGYSNGSHDPAAVNNGRANGTNDGNSAGRSAGATDGDADGYYDGKQVGYDDGYSDGYDDGYYAGETAAYDDSSVCPADSLTTNSLKTASVQGEKVRASHTQEIQDKCTTLGYETTRDAQGFYNKGFAAAKAGNTAYTTAYNNNKTDAGKIAAGKAQGYADGKVKGYSDGKAKGYSDTYNSYYGPAYSSAYDAAYNIAYSNAYYSAWNRGYSDGYDSSSYGYDAGSDDGYADGVYDYCYANYATDSVSAKVQVQSISHGHNTGRKYHASTQYLTRSVAYKTASDYTSYAHAKEKLVNSSQRAALLTNSTTMSTRKAKGRKHWNDKAANHSMWYIKIETGHDYKPLR